MKPASLLRWYPRAWRERYGGELAALIQDNLDEGRPAWRLRLSAIGGGLRERFRQARIRAGMVREYILGRYELMPQNTGFISLGNDAKGSPHDEKWDGVAVALFLETGALQFVAER